MASIQLLHCINDFLQSELKKRNLPRVKAVEAATWLNKAVLLKDSATRPGKPLRELLRSGAITGQEQEANSRWFINRI